MLDDQIFKISNNVWLFICFKKSKEGLTPKFQKFVHGSDNKLFDEKIGELENKIFQKKDKVIERLREIVHGNSVQNITEKLSC